MIYIGKVRPSIMEPPVEQSIIQFFSEYNPIDVVVPDDPEKQKELKTIRLDGFIVGEMKTAHQRQFLQVRGGKFIGK
ncbi:hypothetical protein [Enterococcus faecium]|uniref:hypothetical protein n=1 Tax=Enterococcus faecium TaxID=1352 RepID=UPI000CF1D346|nr:hypothetical protein [Enterococcus faecium]PQD56264.1 hypothetical protein CUM58_04855 [Enterococcus faecium]